MATIQKIQQKEAASEPTVEIKCNPADLKKTTGERMYGILKFGVAEIFILGATAIIAYIARYGEPSYRGIPNFLKSFQEKFEKGLSENRFFPLAKKGDIGELAAKAASSAMVTFHGGNFFAPAMKHFDACQKKIVSYFNKKFGKPGEEEIADLRLKDNPKQNWADVIKGRLVAFAIVFSSFFSADVIGKKTGWYNFDKFEEATGRWLAGLTKKGKELNIGLPGKTNIPLTEKLSVPASNNTTYRFGKILALDIFATTAAIIIWDAISELSARKRKKKTLDALDPTIPKPTDNKEIVYDNDKSFKSDTGAAHAEKITARRQLSDTLQPQIGF